MTEYTQNEKELVFLNDKIIAQKTEDIGTIPYNAIPSLSLFNEKYEELTEEDGKIKLSADGISATVNSLCSQISTAVDDRYEDVLDQVSAVSTLLSAKANLTSADVKYLSSEISTTVGVYETDTFLSTKTKCIKLTNAAYNDKVIAGQVENAAMYIIDDSYVDARGQEIKHLAAPTEEDSAATKLYADEKAEVEAAGSLTLAKEYTDIRIDSLCATVDDNIEAASTAAVGYIDSKIDSLSGTVKNSHYSQYDTFEFDYDETSHYLTLTLKDELGASKTLSVDSTDFIKNRIVDHMQVVTEGGEKRLRIYWKNATGALEYVEIKLTDFAAIYKAGYGISITDDLTISVTDALAKAADLNGVAATVNTLSTTTYSELTAATQAVAEHADSIQGYVNSLSGDGGTINTLTSNVADVQTSVLVNVESRLQALNNGITTAAENIGSLQTYVNGLSATGYGTLAKMDAKTATCEADIVDLKAADTALQGALAGVAVTVNTISSTTIPTLVEEYNELKTGLGTNTAAIGTLNTMYDRHDAAITNIEDVELPGIKSSVTAEVDARKSNDSYLSGVIDNIIKDYALSADVTAIRSDLTGQISLLATEIGQKLTKTEFSTLSNSIGLNAASSTDKVAVKSDLTSFITEAALSPYVLKSTVRTALNGIDDTSNVTEIGAALKSLYDALA